MEIRRVKVPTAIVWAAPTKAKVAQAYFNAPDIATWLAQLSVADQAALADQNTMVTQALLNDRVILDQVQGDWAHVFVKRQATRLERRGYPGWLPVRQLTAHDQELDYPTTTVRLVQAETPLLDDQGQVELTLPLGTVLTTTGQDAQHIQVLTPLGSGKISAQAARLTLGGVDDGDRLLALGREFLGTPYLWGGITPQGFDCSGLVYALHRALDYAIPRDAQDQFTSGYPIAPEALAPGDLVFFAHNHGTGAIHHVGIYAGKGQMLHAPKPGETVTLTSLAQAPYAAEYAGGRRFWQ